MWLRIAITESEVEAKYIGLNPCQKILTKKTSRDKLGQRFLKKKKKLGSDHTFMNISLSNAKDDHSALVSILSILLFTLKRTSSTYRYHIILNYSVSHTQST